MENPSTPQVVVEKNYPSRRLIVGLCAVPLLLLLSVLLVTPLMLVNAKLATSMTVALPLTILAELATIAWGVYYGWAGRWKEALFLKPHWKGIALGAVTGVVLMVLLQLTAHLLGSFGIDFKSSDTSTSLGELTGAARVLLLFMVAPFLVPMIEEVLFRGVIMHSLWRSVLPKKAAAPLALIISSLLFGLMHLQGLKTSTDVLLVLWIVVVALVNGALVMKFKSIWASIASHMAYNGVTVLLLALATS